MRWTCPKCGKKLDISNEQLIANDGVIVCPQCLLQARQPIPKTRIRAREDNSAPPVPARRQSTPPEHRQSTPPPHRTLMKQANTSYRYTGLSGNSETPRKNTPTKRKSSKKKKKKSSGMSAWGCMGRTVVFTLVLFAAYVFFGLLLEALQ